MSLISTRSAKLSKWAEKIWYKDPFIGTWLMPLGFVFADFVRLRKFLYKIGVYKTQRLPVPVIVVGNITVGGSGKTPLVIWLVKLLQEAGYKPGIISRGYGGTAASRPLLVTAESRAEQVGDEALLIVKHTGCPMAVGPLRVATAKHLLDTNACDVIVSDDGLQHYALGRDIEIAVIDGERRFGNGYCLPAGPLREPTNRLQSVDFIIVNGEKSEENEITMQLLGDVAVNVATGASKPLADFAKTECHALAGIGNPGRFFKHLAGFGITCQSNAFPDHYRYQAGDINFNDNQPVFMTEKDAVKCTAFATEQHWYVPVTATLAPDFAGRLLTLLKSQQHDR